jgi:hypothetical protein
MCLLNKKKNKGEERGGSGQANEEKIGLGAPGFQQFASVILGICHLASLQILKHTTPHSYQ